jgi:hypothetical protein
MTTSAMPAAMRIDLSIPGLVRAGPGRAAAGVASGSASPRILAPQFLQNFFPSSI